MRYYKSILFTSLLISFSSLAQDIAVPEVKEKDKKEAADFIKDINSRSDLNYELEAQKIVDKAEETKGNAAKKYAKDVKELNESVEKVQQGDGYKKAESWIKKNQNELFAKQTQALPKIDYDITKDQREKDEIAKLLHNYRFKPDEVKKATITHYPLMIFVSSSIPKNSLKDLMIQAKQAGGILVFRGIIGSLKNTQEFLVDISKENVSAIIDPRLFDIFQIKVVPTFVVLSAATHDCLEKDCQFTPAHDRISGNITLKYALEQIADGKGNSSTAANDLLRRINLNGEKNEK